MRENEKCRRAETAKNVHYNEILVEKNNSWKVLW